MTTNSTLRRLTIAFQEARQIRYEEMSKTSEMDTEPTLLGDRCLRNTYVLNNTLEDHGFDPLIICGGVTETHNTEDTTPKEDDLPSTIWECREEGSIHYWVETADRDYVLDLAAELPATNPLRYYPLISREIPENYYYLDDGVDYTFPVPPG